MWVPTQFIASFFFVWKKDKIDQGFVSIKFITSRGHNDQRLDQTPLVSSLYSLLPDEEFELKLQLAISVLVVFNQMHACVLISYQESDDGFVVATNDGGYHFPLTMHITYIYDDERWD